MSAQICAPVHLPTEILLEILSYLPLSDLCGLHSVLPSTYNPYIDRLMLTHPVFCQRRLYACLVNDPIVAMTLPSQYMPGRPFSMIPSLMPWLTPSIKPTDDQSCHLKLFQPRSFHYVTRQIQFGANEEWLSCSRTLNLAIILESRGIVLKRSIHVANPYTTPLFSRKGYFNGHLQFDTDDQHHMVNLATCTIDLDWFCE
ncbi:uncharacterized protein BYT42DRAFT_221161 [Radiomyces spectabilis]|uniref:uncharacterized protein n=1 Tax=Radiomyces spectabilis TaxID=64574 RepID=UPI00221F0745|nr:uncharacterized protein BYT42DRAFT_221161 [Radiomyces spectabilis]KAI8388087.1 hypothetical protein BYT42DRAFT_221161 [Radiomyces spectabilis]